MEIYEFDEISQKGKVTANIIVLVLLCPSNKKRDVAPHSRDTYPDTCPDFFDHVIANFF